MSAADRKAKDRDFVRTQEGMFFCITGYLHPPDRYTAYLKYSPVPDGKWQDGETGYRREMPYYHIRNVQATLSHLETHYPDYLYHCPVRDIRFSMVPHRCVAHYYVPEQRLQEVIARPQDSLEEEVQALVGYLAETTGIPSRDFGLTGSILTGFHNPAFSDIDLLVYGTANAFSLRRQIKAGQVPLLSLPGSGQVEEWCQRVAERFGLGMEEAATLARRRWNYVYFRERYISIHAIRTDDEITESYGEQVYRGLGAAEVRATVSDMSEALFLPAVYRVQDVQVIAGEPAACEIEEIVSYEGLFCDVAEVGQVMTAYGRLEAVNGEPRRLLVGTTDVTGGGIIRPPG